MAKLIVFCLELMRYGLLFFALKQEYNNLNIKICDYHEDNSFETLLQSSSGKPALFFQENGGLTSL